MQLSSCNSCASAGSCSSSGEGGSCEGEQRIPPGMLDHYDTNQSTADGTLVFIETVIRDAVKQIHPVSAQLLSLATKLKGGRVFGVIFGGIECKDLYDDIFSYGVDSLYHIRNDKLRDFHPEAYSEAITSVCERVIPASVLIGSTLKGKEIAPRVAASMGTGIVTECCGLELNGRKLSMFKTSGDKTIRYECNSFPQVATVEEGIFPMPDNIEGRKGTAIYWQYRGEGFKELL